MSVYLIMTQCDNGAAYASIDQITDLNASAVHEARDLVRMGCGPVRVYQFASWEGAERFEDNFAVKPRYPRSEEILSQRAFR